MENSSSPLRPPGCLGILGVVGLLQAVASIGIIRHNYSFYLMMLSLGCTQHLGSGLAFSRLCRYVYAMFKPLS